MLVKVGVAGNSKKWQFKLYYVVRVGVILILSFYGRGRGCDQIWGPTYRVVILANGCIYYLMYYVVYYVR